MEIIKKVKESLVFSFDFNSEVDDTDELGVFYGLFTKLKEYSNRPGFKQLPFTREEIELIETMVEVMKYYENIREQKDNQGAE